MLLLINSPSRGRSTRFASARAASSAPPHATSSVRLHQVSGADSGFQTCSPIVPERVVDYLLCDGRENLALPRNCVAVMIGLDAREGVITAVTADGYQVSTSKGEVAIGRHDLLRVR